MAICPPGDGTLESWVMLTGNGNKVSFFSELDALIEDLEDQKECNGYV